MVSLCIGAINMLVSKRKHFIFIQIKKNLFRFDMYSANVIRRVGYIHFPHLMQITLLRDYNELINLSPLSEKSPSSNELRSVDQPPTFNPKSKIFELSSILDIAKVYKRYYATVTVRSLKDEYSVLR